VDEGMGQLAPNARGEALARAVNALFEGDWQAAGAAARRRAVRDYGWEPQLDRQRLRMEQLCRDGRVSDEFDRRGPAPDQVSLSA